MLATATATTGPTQAALDRLVAGCAAGLRGGSVAAAGAAAFVGLAPPASAGLVGAAVAGLVGWAAAYALELVRRGWSAPVVGADIAVAVALCLGAGRLVPAAVLADGSSWVFLIASTTVIISQLGPQPALGMVAIGVVPPAYAAGVLLAGHPGAPSFALLLAGQGAVVASMARIVRRSSRAADAAVAEQATAERDLAVRAGRRAEEREHNRLQHASVSATLTVVATGGVAALSPVLRRRAGDDLAAIGRLQNPPGTGPAAPADRSGGAGG